MFAARLAGLIAGLLVVVVMPEALAQAAARQNKVS